MKFHILLSLALAASLAAPEAAAQTSQRVTAGKNNEYALVYSLPRTAVDIQLRCRITEKTPGEFQNYSRRYLGVEDVVREGSRTAEIVDVVISSSGVPNPDERWSAQFKAGSTPYMLLTPQGMPLAINTETPVTPATVRQLEAVAAEPTALEMPGASQAVTQDMARSSSVSKRAELASQRIFELREMRSDILSGQASSMPTDGQAMQLVLGNIAAQEAALTAMFTGTQKQWCEVTTISFVPDSTGMAARVIGRLSAFDGFVDADNLSGEPISATVTITESGKLPLTDKGEPRTFPKGGVAYTIPGTAKVTVTFRGATIAETTMPLAQAGQVFGINPALFTDKKEPTKALFDPATGALLELGPAN